MICICILGTFVGCAGNSGYEGEDPTKQTTQAEIVGEEDENPYMNMSGILYISDDVTYSASSSETWKLASYEVPSNEGVIAAAGEYLYYTVPTLSSDNADYYTQVQIYRINTSDGETEEIYKLENGGEAFFMNELKRTGDYLFWVYFEENVPSIIKYRLETGETSVIKEGVDGDVFVLSSCDDRYIAWFESYEAGKSIAVYDTKLDEIKYISDAALPDSNYTRLYINDGVVSFIFERDDDSGRSFMCVYNLNDNEARFELLVDDDFDFTRLQSYGDNAEYCITTRGYDDDEPNVYTVDVLGQIQKIVLEDLDYTTFSCHVYKNYAVVVSNGEQPAVIVLDLARQTYSKIDMDNYLIYGDVTEEGLFYGFDDETYEIVTLKLK